MKIITKLICASIAVLMGAMFSLCINIILLSASKGIVTNIEHSIYNFLGGGDFMFDWRVFATQAIMVCVPSTIATLLLYVLFVFLVSKHLKNKSSL